MRLTKIVVLFSVLLTCMLIASDSFASGAWSERPGTINNAMTLADGATINLDAVCVEKIRGDQNPAYFVARECFDPDSRIVVLITPPASLRYGQTVDITGTLTTLSNGYRAIENPSIYGYLDSNGNLLYHGPLVKGIEEPTPWPWKELLNPSSNQRKSTYSNVLSINRISSLSTAASTDPPGTIPTPSSDPAPITCSSIAAAKTAYDTYYDATNRPRVMITLQCYGVSNPATGSFTLLEDGTGDTIPVYATTSVQTTDRINKITATILKNTSGNYWLEVDAGPSWQSQDVMGSLQKCASGTIAWAKTFADSATLPAALTGKVVSRTFPSLNYFYIQEADRSSGICVYDSSMAYSVSPGALVDISGVMSSSDGERVINASSTSWPVQYTSIKPLFVTSRNLSGGAFNTITNGAQGATGLNNVGLLVRISGKVTQVGNDFLYLDDGSSCIDGTLASDNSQVRGVRVVGSTQYIPNVGDQIAVTGISGLATYPSGYGRTLRLADPADLTAIYPPLPPDGLFATPSGANTILLYWNEVPGATGYNIYRSTTSGQEDYTSPVNGTTPVTTRVSSTSDLFTFTNSGLQADTTYYYTVKAVAGSNETQASNEDSATTSAGAIPWESRDPASIVSAARTRSPESVTCPIDVIGPDGTVYTSEGSVFLHAVSGPPGPEPDDVSMSTQILGMSMSAQVSSNQPKPEPNNAHSGPYRKVEANPNYRKIVGTAVLPTAAYIHVSPKTYPNEAKRTKKGKLIQCPNSGDIPYMYLGSLGAHSEHVDAGLRYEASDGMWNMFFLIGPSHTFWVFDPNMPTGADPREYPTPSNNSAWLQFPCGYSVNLEYWCGKDIDTQNRTVKNGVWLRATGTSGQRAVFAEVSGHPQSGAGVAMKRVSSIGQYLPINYPQSGQTDSDTGYVKSGSYFLNGEWSSIQVYDMTRAWYVDASHARYKQEFPVNDANIVTFHMQAPYYWENQINIDLR